MSRLLEEFKEYLKEMNQYDHVTGLLPVSYTHLDVYKRQP